MFNKNALKFSISAFAITVASFHSNAAVVTSLPGGTVLIMPITNYFGAGPKILAPGVTWSSQSSRSVFGYTNGYGFSSNGMWNSGLTMIGSNDSSSTMTLKFDNAVQGAGAFINWAPNTGLASIAAYDSGHNLIESTNITFNTDRSNNSGEFVGFQESISNISYFTFTGAYIGAANITVLASAVSEPDTCATLLAGLGLMGFMVRRRKIS